MTKANLREQAVTLGSGEDSQEDASQLEAKMDGTPIPNRHKSSGGAVLELRFEADEWGRLTVEERLRRCHLMAEEALKLAKTAPNEIAESYLQIANDWLQLATEMQKVAPRAQSARANRGLGHKP